MRPPLPVRVSMRPPPQLGRFPCQRCASFTSPTADKLQELLNKAEGPDALPDERKEMEELKALLPEIQEKVEDATEGLKMTNAAAEDGTGAAVSRGSEEGCLGTS